MKAINDEVLVELKERLLARPVKTRDVIQTDTDVG
jgi:hypothetical protein